MDVEQQINVSILVGGKDCKPAPSAKYSYLTSKVNEDERIFEEWRKITPLTMTYLQAQYMVMDSKKGQDLCTFPVHLYLKVYHL